MSEQAVSLTRICITCEWYHVTNPKEGIGMCRRYPPRMHLMRSSGAIQTIQGRSPAEAITERTSFPQVKFYCGCGEWTKVEDEKDNETRNQQIALYHQQLEAAGSKPKEAQ